MSIRQCDEMRWSCYPSYCITFPMPDHTAVVHFFWPQFNRIADSDLASRFLFTFLVTSFSVMPQLSGHAALTFGKPGSLRNASVNPAIYRWETHLDRIDLLPQAIFNLFRRPLFIQKQMLYQCFVCRVGKYCFLMATFPASTISSFYSAGRVISLRPSISVKFTADCWCWSS